MQGTTSAAKLLSHLYANGIGGLDKNKDLADYWMLQSRPSLAFALQADEHYPEVTKESQEIDPLKLKVE